MLTHQQQQWNLRALLEGKERSVDRRQFTDPFLNGCYRAIAGLPPHERKAGLIDYLASRYTNWKDLLKGITSAKPPAGGRHYPSFAELADSLPPIEWFWPGWIPYRFLSALAAPPGAGKSMIALDLARRAMAKEPAPDGAPIQTRGPYVIYVDAENVPQITYQRAWAWDMPLQGLYPMLPQRYSMVDLNRNRDRDALIQMTDGLRPSLVVVDSLSMVTSRGDGSVEEVRPILSFLANLAADFDCAVLLIHHTRKRAQNVPPGLPMTVDDLRGSGHIVSSCRSVLALSVLQVGPKPDPNGVRRLEVIKTNLGAHPKPLGATFVPEGEEGVRVVYSLEAPEPYTRPSAAEGCAAWLLQLLEEAGKPLPPGEIVAAAGKEGYSERTVYRARKRLGDQIEDTVGRRSPGNAWSLRAS